MTNILSSLQNLLNPGGGSASADFMGPQQPPVQGPPQPTILQQISAGYEKNWNPDTIGQQFQGIGKDPGFNQALMRLGTTLLAAREKGMGLGEGLSAGQTAFNSEIDRAKQEQAKIAAAKLEQQKYLNDMAFKLQNANLEQSKYLSGLDADKQKLALEYFKANQERNKPQSATAKLTADFNAGLIDKDTFTRAMAKEIAPLEKNYKLPQLQAASFADRMAKSEGLLQPLEASGVSMINNTASSLSKVPVIGDYLENKALTEDQQLYKNASTEWIRAKLRKESGAAIGKDEMDKEFRTYFPMPGDTAKVIAQKALLRKNNTASMIKQASGAYEEQYLGETPGQTTSAPAMSGMTPMPMGIQPQKQVDPTTTGIVRTALEQGLQGATFGFGDELSNRGGAAIASLLTDEKYKDLLAEAQANSKQRLPAQIAANPFTGIASNIAGGMLTGSAGAAGLKSTTPILSRALETYAATNPYKTAAGLGAASGALYGAGTGEGSLKQRIPDALLGGMAGGVAGPVAAYVGRNAIAPITNKLSPLVESATSKINSLIPKLPNAAPPLPESGLPTNAFNANLVTQEGNLFSKTAGQRTQNPNLQRLENDARAGTLTKDAERAILQADVQQNREFHSYMNDLAKGLDKGADPNVLVEGVSDVIKSNAKAAKQGVNNAYDLAREGKGVKIGSQEIRQGLWKGITDIRRENAYDLSQMPKATGVIKRLATYSKQGNNNPISAVKLGELENWRKQATNAFNSSQDPTEREFLREMVRCYDGFMEKTAENAVDIGDSNAIKAFRDAVKQRRDYGRLFESNKLVGDVVSGQKSIDDTVKSLIGTGSIKGKKEMANNVDALLKASGNQAPIVQNDLRQAFTLNAFKKAVVGYEPNNPSMERLSPAILKTELENIFIHQSDFADKLYGKDVRLAAQKAIKELDLIATSQANVKNPSGSGEWIGRFLKAPGVNRIPGMGLVGKAVEAQKQHVQGAQVTKGLSDFITEQQQYQTPFWSIVPPVAAAGLVNRQE